MKNALLIYILISGSSLVRLDAQVTASDSLINKLWLAGAEARSLGAYAEALLLYHRALAIAPNDPELLNSRGKTYFDMAMSERFNHQADSLVELAIADYTEGLAQAAKPVARAEMLINRGAAYGAQNKLEQALTDLTAGILADPANKNGYYNRSLLHYNLRQFEEAIADYTSYLDIDPDHANVWYERGMVQRSLGRNKKAIQDLNRAIQLQPDHGLSYLERARAQAQAGHKKAARRDYQRAQQLKVPLTPQDVQLMED